jgi:hypothetical protein
MAITPHQKITLAEMRASGVRGLLGLSLLALDCDLRR